MSINDLTPLETSDFNVQLSKREVKIHCSFKFVEDWNGKDLEILLGIVTSLLVRIPTTESSVETTPTPSSNEDSTDLKVKSSTTLTSSLNTDTPVPDVKINEVPRDSPTQQTVSTNITIGEKRSKLYDATLVLMTQPFCQHSKDVLKLWNGSLLSQLSALYPLRFHSVTIGSEYYDIFLGRKGSPKGLSRYTAWSPMLLLIPGKLWTTAVQHLDDKIDLIDGVQIMNGKWENNVLTYATKYDIKQSKDIIQWVQDCIDK